ncbi:MAG: hypothetical protein QOH99_186 [Frankiaceae bacterium]|nr:hypothetical protein [Frankiaceae bacterium]
MYVGPAKPQHEAPPDCHRVVAVHVAKLAAGRVVTEVPVEFNNNSVVRHVDPAHAAS